MCTGYSFPYSMSRGASTLIPSSRTPGLCLPFPKFPSVFPGGPRKLPTSWEQYIPGKGSLWNFSIKDLLNLAQSTSLKHTYFGNNLPAIYIECQSEPAVAKIMTRHELLPEHSVPFALWWLEDLQYSHYYKGSFEESLMLLYLNEIMTNKTSVVQFKACLWRKMLKSSLDTEIN